MYSFKHLLSKNKVLNTNSNAKHCGGYTITTRDLLIFH